MLLAMTVLMAACTSESNEETNEKSDDNAKKYAKVFEETDSIAHDFMVVKIEQNYPEILNYLSLNGIDELKEDREYLLKKHRLPEEFEKLDGMYELRRYDNFYEEESGEVYYRYRTPDNKGSLVNSWIVLIKDEDKVWKVRSYFDSRPEMIDDNNAETGTVLHEFPEND